MKSVVAKSYMLSLMALFCLAVVYPFNTKAEIGLIYGGGGDIGGGGGDIGGGGGDIGGGADPDGGGLSPSEKNDYNGFLLELINIKKLHDLGLKGAGHKPKERNQGVVIIDSGVSSNFRGRDRVTEFKDFVGNCTLENPCDGHSHGTVIADLVHQVAPQANLIILRVLDERLTGYRSSVLKAINWAIKNKRKHNIGVINMSLQVDEKYFGTHWVEILEIHKAVARAARAGIKVVACAGNFSEEGTKSIPGNAPEAITVGSIHHGFILDASAHTISNFTNLGTAIIPTYKKHLFVNSLSNIGSGVGKPDILAPGESIFAQIERGTAVEAKANLRQQMANTSDLDTLRLLISEYVRYTIASGLDQMLALTKQMLNSPSYSKFTYTQGYKYFLIDDTFSFAHGTSAASAIVAGGIAVLNQAFPKVKSEVLKEKMRETATAPKATVNDYNHKTRTFNPKTIGGVDFFAIYESLKADANSLRKHRGADRTEPLPVNP